VKNFFARRALQTQLLILALGCVVATALTATVVVLSTSPDNQVMRLRLIASLSVVAAVSLGLMHFTFIRLLGPLRSLREAIFQAAEGRLDTGIYYSQQADVYQLRQNFGRVIQRMKHSQAEQERAQQSLHARTRTVDRLLEFSQNIQGAGKADQVFATLGHFLWSELGLAGLTVLTSEPDAIPAVQSRVCLPPSLMAADRPLTEMESSMCPCLRNQLPRHFRADGSPVRCSIDSLLTLGADHPAFCIPFRTGGAAQAVAHMLLSPGQEWTEDQKHLAQTYVNTAQSALISLHLLNEAEKQSMTDPLTQLFNRRSLDSLMQREVALAERHHHALSLVIIDMDKFKQVNDTHGHAAGDHMLKAFADCVRITLRKTDLAFRYGGDEFVIALPQTTTAQAQAVVQKLRQAFGAVDFSDAIAHLDHQPTLSIGVAERSAANGVLTLQSLLAAADQALYDAKASDRNCVKVYQPTKAA